MRGRMESYPRAAVERAMKVQEVILRAMAKKITWWQAAEILGISDRQMRRWRERYERLGYDGLIDRRRGRPSGKRVPLATVEQVLRLYRELYFDLNVSHFHEKLSQEHGIGLSYTWVKRALQGANAFLRDRFVAEFNGRFQVPAAGEGSAFTACRRDELDLVFSLQFERMINRDNTVSFENMSLQLEAVGWRGTLAGCRVTVHRHLEGGLTVTLGSYRLGRYTALGGLVREELFDQQAEPPPTAGAEEKTRSGKVQKTTFPDRLEIPPSTWDSHFPSAPTTTA
jgi:transposase